MPAHYYKKEKKIIMYMHVPTFFICTSYDHYSLKTLPPFLSHWTMLPCFIKTTPPLYIISSPKHNKIDFLFLFLFLLFVPFPSVFKHNYFYLKTKQTITKFFFNFLSVKLLLTITTKLFKREAYLSTLLSTQRNQTATFTTLLKPLIWCPN